ncbi:MAG TPA: hypothetical protein VF984_04575 [Actinomycetota bacterium]
MPAPEWAPPPPRKQGARTILVAAAVLVGVLAAGLVIKTVLFRPGIGFPDQLAGLSRNESPVSRQVTDFIENLADGFGFEVHVGLYGSSQFQPELMIVAFERADAPPGAFDDFASGFTSTSGQGVGEPVRERRGEVEYQCAAVQPSASTVGSPQTLCQWTDPATGGFLASTNPVDPGAAIDLAAEVHDAVVN